MVRSLPTQSRRVIPASIWWTRVRYLWPLAYWISSTPMARSIPRASPDPRNHIFDRVAHLVPGSVGTTRRFPSVSCASAGQNSMWAWGDWCLPSLQEPVPPRCRSSGNGRAASVQKENQKAPERDELEPPLGQMIVEPAAGRRQPEHTPQYPGADARLLRSSCCRAEAGVRIDEYPLAINDLDRDEFHAADDSGRRRPPASGVPPPGAGDDIPVYCHDLDRCRVPGWACNACRQ